MNFLEEIKKLEEQGVFINFLYDHYESGSNCNFSIVFVENGKKKYQTSWNGDNHEYGDTHENMQAAVLAAKWLIEDKQRLKDYFECSEETITEEGRAKYEKHRETRTALGKYLYENHEPHRKASDRMTEAFEEWKRKNNEE